MAHSTSTKRKTSRPVPQKRPRTKVTRTAQSVAQDSSNIPEIDLARAQKTVLDLLKIPGISGQEKQVAEAIRKKLLDAGCSKNIISFDQAHKKTPLKGNCGNLIVKFPGTRRGPRRLLMAHMDTVPVCEGTKPVLRGDIVKSGNPATGLGADDRSGCGVVLSTALEILRQKIDHPPLTFFFAIQEEVGLWGARTVKAIDLGKPKLAFNFDGGNVDKLTIGATGGERLDITIEGIPSHAGVAPEHGVSAIAIASLAIASLHEDGWHGLVEKGSKRGTSNIGVIHGGAATNVVAERATLRAEARGHDTAFRNRIVRAIEKAFKQAANQVKSASGRKGTVSISKRLDYEAFQLTKNDPSITTAHRALQALGHTPYYDISNGGLDANWMAANGIPTVTLGCGQHDIHTTNEWLDLKTYKAACQTAIMLATMD
ncbi:MAG: M20/M25/M40 family metallo-hydrolase [Pirellulales bacterium]|nr:M20/M25/M40 family metallo-hydrolase [Pirellulales bacterium]|tara:strand:- start:1056 stop:2339 length:1284 start_codon:yes stop_codon:yes gene_type:complete